jgi:hypothetical protein
MTRGGIRFLPLVEMTTQTPRFLPMACLTSERRVRPTHHQFIQSYIKVRGTHPTRCADNMPTPWWASVGCVLRTINSYNHTSRCVGRTLRAPWCNAIKPVPLCRGIKPPNQTCSETHTYDVVICKPHHCMAKTQASLALFALVICWPQWRVDEPIK